MVFAMTFGLMLSDYLSRQVINAVFPFLKADWGLTDTQLGSLVSVVALTIGLTSIPISLVADRVGRVKSATVMALIWGSATIACGLAGNFTSLLIARAAVGLGEAGYGSAGAAILTHAFPQRLHATVMGSFLAAGMIGSVLGVVTGGFVAQWLGWPVAFMVIGAFGLIFAAFFPMVVKEPPAAHAAGTPKLPIRQVFRTLLTTRTLVLVALAGGFSMFVQGTFIAWIPSYLNRYYGFDPAKAAVGTALLIVCASIGMIVGGGLVDRLSRHNKDNRLRICVVYCSILALALLLAFSLEPGIVQFLLIGLGLSMSSSFLGPALAVAADVTPVSNHATTFAILALAYMLIGAAPGPFVTGWIADVTSLKTALFLAPIGGLVGACFFFLASRTYRRDRERVHGN
jgi:MFS family permease